MVKEFFGAPVSQKSNEKPISAADREEMNKRQEQLKRQLLEEFPILMIREQPVPDDQNGFLQIMRFGKNPGYYQMEEEVVKELSACLEPWDSAKVRAFLEKHPGFAAEAARIAALPAQSSTVSAEDYSGFIRVSTVIALHNVFLLNARLAAESGNEAAALDAARHALQIKSHLSEVEEPSLLAAFAVILMDRERMKWVTDTILPRIGPKADLAAWRVVIGDEINMPARMAKVIRGEWNTTLDHMFLPCTFLEHHNGNLKDPEETARVWSGRMARWIAKLEGTPAVGFHDLSPPDESHQSDALSKEGKEIVDTTVGGAPVWSKGFVRSVVLSAQNRALIDRLIHERDGSPVPDTIDPASGLPFRFDPATRTIIAPEWDGAPENVPPLKLPW